MQKPDIKDLLDRYHAGNCSDEERTWIENWYLNWDAMPFDLSREELMADLQLIAKDLPRVKKRRAIFLRLTAAAAMLLFIGAGTYFFLQGEKEKAAQADVATKVVPARNHATLVLADGKTIVLDDKAGMAAIKQDGLKITRDAKGILVFTAVETKAYSQGYNSVNTPKGGRYDVVLPDGTRVSLNAASSLRFPLTFPAGERRVTLDGEGYFEVAKDAKRPFKVYSANQVVRVLGTHFNISSYADEPLVKTTLLEGSVMVSGKNRVVLRPGEQAQGNRTADSFKVLQVDTENELAWKNDMFFFENEPISEIMKEISRWYDVEIVYQDAPGDKKIWGSINRFSDLSKVLAIIELTGNVHFKTEGRRITVMR